MSSSHGDSSYQGTPSAYRTQDSFGWEPGEDLKDDADLGDLSDVPREHLYEVADVIRSLPGGGVYPGGIDELRSWIQQVRRLGGFSREASLRLFAAISRLLSAPRPRDENTPLNAPTMVHLQQAFVRMKGVRETINVLLLRLSDPTIVASACRLLAAAVQGSPHTVEFMLDDKPEDIRLLLRAIERHQADLSVAEAGCMLISHLCSHAPVPGGVPTAARAKPHRDCQSTLQKEGGVLDLVLNILSTSVQTLGKQAAEVEAQHAKVTEATNSIQLPKGGATRQAGGANKATLDVSQAWMHLHETENTAGQVQNSALQALLLLCFGNANTTRQLAGELWCLGRVIEAEEAIAKEREAAEAAKKNQRGKKHHRPHHGKGHGKGHHSHKNAGNGSAPDQKFSGLPEGEQRCALTTLEAFRTTSKLLVQVLEGRAARDRPAIATKVCRLLGVLVERAIHLVRQIEDGRRKEFAELAVTLRPGPIPADDRKALAPFAPLEGILGALTLAVRTHISDASLLATALDLFKKLKSFALSAAPAGCTPGSEEMLYAWQHVLGGAEDGDELAHACKVLERTLECTQIGDNRIAQSICTADGLDGEAVYLTPRMREFVVKHKLEYSEIAGDALAHKWKSGDPERKKRSEDKSEAAKAGAKAERDRQAAAARVSPAAKAMSTPTAKSAARKNMAAVAVATSQGSETPMKRDRHADEGQRRGSTEIAGHVQQMLADLDAPPAKSPEKKKGAGHNRRGASVEQDKENEVDEEIGWKRALGYHACDQDDFKRVWEEPLTHALQRSLSMTSLERHKQRKNWLREGVELPPDESGFQLKYVDSEPGLLRAQIILPSWDRRHQSASDLRVKQLTDADVSNAEVAPTVAKHLKRHGNLMPEFGIQVVIKRGQRSSALASAGSDVIQNAANTF